MTTATNSPDASTTTRTIALVGNPNCGKSTLFNALTGLRQKVGNYPGVTVERRVGTATRVTGEVRVVDLPGTYSLTPCSPDEELAVDVLNGRAHVEDAPDVIVDVCDASNLPRNLFLTTELLDLGRELGRPVVCALTMVDIARGRDDFVDVEKLARRLGVDVIPVNAVSGEGLDELMSAVAAAEIPTVAVVDSMASTTSTPDDHDYESMSRSDVAGREPWRRAAESRYRWIDATLADVRTKPKTSTSASTSRPAPTDVASDRVDRILLHPWLGPFAFLAVMFLLFQAVFTWAGPAADALEGVFGFLGEGVASLLGPGMLTELLTDGVVAGVANILVFLPQIVLLFLFIAILEDSGYMARAVMIVDRPMRLVGLHGKSFVPLLSSFACAIPGIMATRAIESRQTRFVTMLVAPLMSCSARLPVYVLLTAAFFGGSTGLISQAGLVMFAMYLLGMVAAFVVAGCAETDDSEGRSAEFGDGVAALSLSAAGSGAANVVRTQSHVRASRRDGNPRQLRHPVGP